MRTQYNCAEGCPVESTLQFISGKWKSVILYHLLLNQVLRFSDLQRKLPYITKRMLAKQLVELEADGMIYKTVYPEVPVKTDYRLTNFGQSFAPVIQAMARWGTNYNQQ